MVLAVSVLIIMFLFYQSTFLNTAKKYLNHITKKGSKQEWSIIQKYKKESICNNLFKDFEFPEEVKNEYETFEQNTEKLIFKKRYVEGHIGQLVAQQKLYYHLSRVESVKTICEIGFNLGHSAFMWLVGSKAKLYSFDLGHHGYVRGMAEYMSKTFPGRFNITYGSSEKTVPEFTKANPDIKCNILSVDGAHTYHMAKTDMTNFQKLASNVKNVLIFDDYPSRMFKTLGKAWKEMLDEHKIRSLLECSFKPKFNRGFSVGSYIF